ncbi:MAG: methionyl-tRNA formyltransferase [Anaerovoracaceae bacterium]|jgi:methionyl-tRNA formyltransferase
MKIIFMGTPEFSAVVLKRLLEAGHEICCVVTQPDRRRNRGKVTYSAVKELALEEGLEVLQPERLSKSPEMVEHMRSLEPDVVIVVSFGQILKQDVLDLPKLGCFNVHASLLPKFRGASPMQHAILSGEEKTGVTIMKMDAGLDTGDMIAKAETDVDHKTFHVLYDELAELGADLLVRTLPSIEDGTCRFVPQDDEKSTYAGLLKKEDGKVDFSRKPEEIERQIRAFDPWPGAYCIWRDARLKLWSAECPDETTDLPDGAVAGASAGGIDIACSGRILRVTELQMPGKKRLKAEDFLRGKQFEKGELLK